MDDTILLKIMFLVAGSIITIVYFAAMLYFFNKNKKEKKYTCKTDGEVISNIRREEIFGADRIRDKRIRWYSLCEYKVGDTKCVRETNIGTLQPREIGTIVTIHYNPDNCHEAYIEGDNNSIIKAFILLICVILQLIFIFLIIKVFLNN